MRIRNGYLLRELAGQTYLLPYGQNITDHKRGIRLNECSLLLLEALKDDISKEDLLDTMVSHYQTEAPNIPMLQEDLESFLNSLKDLGILEVTKPQPTPRRFFSIGPLRFGYQGPDSLIHPSFEDFSANPGPVDQTIVIESGYPGKRSNGSILVRNEEITICDMGSEYLFLYPRHTRLLECHLKKDGSLARFFCVPPLESNLALVLFHALRFSFMVLAQRRGLFLMHSSSILYRDRAWLFSGRSGTGKSTHADLWNANLGTPIINGDLNLLGIEEEIPYVYGIPWCGTSGIYSTKRYPLGGITLLKQSASDKMDPLSDDEKLLLTTQRFISPTWTEDLLTRCLDFSQNLVPGIGMFRLLCTKNPSAAHTMRREIDKYLT